MTDDSDSMTALVTGANGGIGLASVLELARRGHDVVGTVRSEAKADEVAAAADAAGVTVRTCLLDITDVERAQAVVDEHRPSLLVNNAGFADPGAIEDVEEGEAEALLETLAVAPMRLARLVIPHMRAAGSGRIINISSILARVPSPVMGWYSAAKRALEGASDALRLEVASAGIEVVLVQPGGVGTGVFDSARERLEDRGGDNSNYKRPYRIWSELTQRAEGLMSSAELVAKTVADVAQGPVKPRYLVGLDAHLIDGVERFAPVRVRDAATRMILGL